MALANSLPDSMTVGMLWFDKSPDRPLDVKIARAADYYQQKYGPRPTTCFVHPSMLLAGAAQVTGIEVRPSNSVLPNHFWLGAPRAPFNAPKPGLPAVTKGAEDHPAQESEKVATPPTADGYWWRNRKPATTPSLTKRIGDDTYWMSHDNGRWQIGLGTDPGSIRRFATPWLLRQHLRVLKERAEPRPPEEIAQVAEAHAHARRRFEKWLEAYERRWKPSPMAITLAKLEGRPAKQSPPAPRVLPNDPKAAAEAVINDLAVQKRDPAAPAGSPPKTKDKRPNPSAKKKRKQEQQAPQANGHRVAYYDAKTPRDVRKVLDLFADEQGLKATTIFVPPGAIGEFPKGNVLGVPVREDEDVHVGKVRIEAGRIARQRGVQR